MQHDVIKYLYNTLHYKGIYLSFNSVALSHINTIRSPGQLLRTYVYLVYLYIQARGPIEHTHLPCAKCVQQLNVAKFYQG